MKVILKQDYDTLGKQGEAVSVKDGYAMNYLIPNHIAVKATASNLRTLEELKKQKAKKVQKEIDDSKQLAGALSSAVIVIKAKAGDDEKLFGSVTAQMISESLGENGFTVDKKHIILEEPIKHVGEFMIDVKLPNNISTQLKVQVEKE
jgi:large subunit ribosomal protein L9